MKFLQTMKYQNFLQSNISVCHYGLVVLKKREKFGDVVKDIFPSQWFFHASRKNNRNKQICTCSIFIRVAMTNRE